MREVAVRFSGGHTGLHRPASALWLKYCDTRVKKPFLKPNPVGFFWVLLGFWTSRKNRYNNTKTQ